ncbi:MAG TPA: non-heme iron oxygenase ferredoxin subunit [Candidatus Marinimicrobia bacterium]|nr:non-heme iron oxygenase ferredoxin subunit [Candidatus Neomarinimicrobiota bacterium]HIB96451.1 non-heme iron oxygenase ferredoxin subunit [Candidatus Neomarinimicrobiota bacterium]HIO37048.1 non-heme iron oxygenase ferredoxin subunit [Candidatus Neomarinimicrobiota bacterium]
MSGWKKLLDCPNLLPQSGQVVMMDEKPVALFNIDGEFIAMDNKCPHRGGSLGDGEIEGDIVTCPWHGWQFNCRTGKAVENDAIIVRTYEIENRSEGIFIKVN